ncbi:hypothetical protein SAMN05421827_12437 [Pedobacter terrae]|uniref:Uncharacterized protein n=1 Tax=Pedobacter terrae TaxID=405671 RepID=A0A1G8CB97_9SPHI|nr:hypothetical protein SAMN05421827_11776 [Pedobacter terrae]SDH42734.1 hypothetical protein SAMN05421827_12437 [Pedobacter terrae]
MEEGRYRMEENLLHAIPHTELVSESNPVN